MIKKTISLFLAVLMIMAIFPFAAIMSMAAGTPVAQATLDHSVSLDFINDVGFPLGDGHHLYEYVRKYNFKNIKYTGASDVEAISQAYCIEKGIGFDFDTTRYFAYLPEDSKYFATLNNHAKRGILLSTAFGYPAVPWSEWQKQGLTDVSQAIAATQALIWEFQVGNRKEFTGNATIGENPNWAYSIVDGNEGARSAYWSILASCQQWLDEGGEWRQLMDESDILIWEQSDSGNSWEKGNSAQTLITYKGQPYTPRGSISVKKTDEDNVPLQGAEFTILKSDGSIVETLVTDKNGYAITEGETEYPNIPFGTYTVVETKAPAYIDVNGKTVEYKPVGATSWTVEVDSEHKHVTVNATNRKDAQLKITKSYEGDIDYASFIQFAVYDNKTNTKLMTLTTGTASSNSASTQSAILPLTESREYRVEEITTGPYDCFVWNGTQWVDMDSYVFKYSDVTPGEIYELKIKNVPHKGFAKIKKSTSDNSPLDGFYFEITKPGDSSFAKISGYTNSQGYLINNDGLIELDPGEYLLTEILTDEQAQKFVEPVPITFSIKSDVTTPITYTNTPAQSSIRIIKTSEDGVVVGAKFRIEGRLADGQTFEKVCVVEDTSGIIFVTEDDNGKNVIAGEYTITEIDVDGRYKQPQEQTIIITPEDNGKTIDVSFENKLNPINVAVFKTSEDGIVNDISFILRGKTDGGNNIITRFDTNEKGIATPTLNIYPGEYDIVESKFADGRYVTQARIHVKLYIDSDGNAHYIDEDGNVYDTETYTNANGTQKQALVFRVHNVVKKFNLTINKVNGLTGVSVSYGDSTLEGAVYGLYKDGVLVESKATGANGKVVFSTQVCGDGYTVKEISPSVGFYLDQTVYTVDADPLNFDEEYNNISLTVKEEPIMGTVSINKLVGTETDNAPEIGATFQIYPKSAGSYKNATIYERDTLVTKLVEDSNLGIAAALDTSKALPYGTYIVHQISGDERFEFVKDFEIVIDSSNEHINASYTLLNGITEKTVTVSKKDITGENSIPGAVLVLEDSEGNKLQGATDENGEIVFTVMPGQTFTLYEISAPSGYSLNSTPVTFTLDIYGAVINGSTEIRNDPNKYIVKKVDEDGNALPGATFEMKNAATGEVFATVTTGANGLAVFASIPFGTYVVKEIEAPAGYRLTDKELTITVDGTWINLEEGEFNDTVVNEPIVVVLEKIDAETLVGIEGAEITVLDENGEVYVKAITDTNGRITLNNIPAGKYKFFESYSPEHYELNSTVFEFTVNEYGVVTGDASIPDESNKYIVKKTDKDGNALPGATFEMKDVATGEVFATVTTGADGLAVFTSIPFGSFEIREVKAPAGYKLSQQVLTITVDGTWTNLEEGKFNDSVVNEPTEVVITKTDLTGSTVIANAEITIYGENGAVVAQGKTDNDGRFAVYNLPTGKYTFKETYAAETWAINANTFSFEILEDGSFIGDNTITDDVNKYTVKKVDKNGNPLANAVFEMKNVTTGEIFATVTTGADGLAVFTSIPFGTYIVKEIEAPAGYKLTDKEFTIVVDGTWVNVQGEIYDTLVNSNTQVVINKTDTLGNTLAGAEITVYDADGKAYFVGITDENGNLTINNIIVGRYTFKETKAPEGYELNTNVYEFAVDEYGVVTGTTSISDGLNKYVVKKVDEDGNTLSGAIFEMKNVATGEIFATITTGADGLAVFENIPFGNYVVYEKQAPAGYKLSDAVLEVTINETWVNISEGEVNGTIVNEDTVVIITKTEIATGTGIPNATITVYDENGNVYAEGKSAANGEFAIHNIIPGKYTFKETYAPNGYEINTMTFEFEVTIEGEIIGGTNITDKPNKYVVKKTDKDGNPLANATFVIKNIDTDEIFATIITGTDGLAIFTSIPYGNYVIYETEAPAGYKLSDKVIELVVDGKYENLGEDEINDIVVNEDTVLVIDKTDASTGEAVPNAVIVIYDADGNVYFEGVTDENGLITIYNIIPGKYTWCETKAPDGYKLNKTVFEFEVTIEGEVIGDTSITNEPTKVVISKTDLTGENVIEGAEITIYDADCKTVFVGLTDKDGKIDVSYLPVGEYTFKETYAAETWAINTNTFSFEILEDGSFIGDNTITDDVVRITINKVNEKNEPLENVEFSIYDSEGKLVAVGLTDGNGQVVFEGLEWNEYIIKETKTVEGYYLSSEEIKIAVDGTWDNASKIASVTIVNRPELPMGDTTNMLIWAILAVLAVVCGAFAVRKRIVIN